MNDREKTDALLADLEASVKAEFGEHPFLFEDNKVSICALSGSPGRSLALVAESLARYRTEFDAILGGQRKLTPWSSPKSRVERGRTVPDQYLTPGQAVKQSAERSRQGRW